MNGRRHEGRTGEVGKRKGREEDSRETERRNG